MLGAATLGLFASQNDPFFTSVITLNHWTGTAGQFDSLDQIPFRTWNRFGTTGTQISATQSRFGTTSLVIPASATAANGPYLTTNSAFVLGTGDFTIELWVYYTSNPQTGDAVLHDWRTGAGQDSTAYSDYFVAGTGGTFKYLPWLNGGSPTPTIQMSLNTWYHIAITRASGVIKTWINGVNDITWTVTRNLSLASPVPKIGTRYSGGGGNTVAMYVNDYRVTKGVARYTANFTPSLSPFPNQ
jgi:hypothetical protein